MIKDTINQLLIQIKDQELHQLIHLIADDHRRLKERVEYLERQLYGKKQEKNLPKLTHLQETLLFDVQENDEVDVYEQNGSIIYKRKKNLKKRIHKLELSNLPKREVIHDLTEEEKYCATCCYPLHQLGEERSTQVEMIPAQYLAIEHIHIKYACRHCEQVIRGSKKPSAIPKSMVANSMLAKVVVDKYVHHLPIYRQAMIYKSHGLSVSDYTIGRWTTQLQGILEPLKEALWSNVVNAPYLQIDETPVLCLEQKKKCYMWSYAAFHLRQKPSLVLFDFQITRGSSAVNDRLANFEGIVQTDGYAGYNALRMKPGVVGIGCGAHIRRKFVDVASMSHGPYLNAEKAINYFKQLYAIESVCREMRYEAQERQAYRQSKAKPIIDEFHLWLQQLAPLSPPKSALGKAIAYALDEWAAWSSYIHYGEAEIDTNWVENQIRPFAVGRRNWLFVGNQRGGETSALLYSLVHSARLNGLEPWRYLFYVLNHAHELRKGLINPEDLLPHHIDPSAINTLTNQYMSYITSLLMNSTDP